VPPYGKLDGLNASRKAVGERYASSRRILSCMVNRGATLFARVALTWLVSAVLDGCGGASVPLGSGNASGSSGSTSGSAGGGSRAANGPLAHRANSKLHQGQCALEPFGERQWPRSEWIVYLSGHEQRFGHPGSRIGSRIRCLRVCRWRRVRKPVRGRKQQLERQFVGGDGR
jgi:hypothetical protein